MYAASEGRFKEREAGKRVGNCSTPGGLEAKAIAVSAEAAATKGYLLLLPSCTDRLVLSLAGHLLDYSLVAGSQASVPDILAIAGDVMGDLLDKQQGHTVTDKDIYRYISNTH